VQVLPSSAPRHAVTVWYFSEGELQAEGGKDSGRLQLHRIEPGSELQPGQTGRGGAGRAREGLGEGMGTCSTASAGGPNEEGHGRT
jgi:hypothetical protein